jgi:hypothetical protein
MPLIFRDWLQSQGKTKTTTTNESVNYGNLGGGDDNI